MKTPDILMLSYSLGRSARMRLPAPARVDKRWMTPAGRHARRLALLLQERG
jgi:hypothetical protein